MSSNHQITSGQARLAAQVVGDGDPVVFLHAAVCDSRMWRAQLDAVGASNMAIAYDRRGFGETRAEKEDFSLVADLLAVIDAVGNGAVWVASVPGKHCVRVAEGGKVLNTVALDRGCFACMLGGEDGRTLFIAAAQWRGMEAAMKEGPGLTGQLLAAPEQPAPHGGRP